MIGNAFELTISNTTFTDNTANGMPGGGAISISDAKGITAEITDSDFDNNKAERGGSLSVQGTTGSQLSFHRCNFNNNEATTTEGGAVRIEDNDLTIQFEHTTFTANKAETDGGGLYLIGNGDMLECTFNDVQVSGNNAAGTGGGIYAKSMTINLSKTTITDNKATKAGGIWFQETKESISDDTKFTNNDPSDIACENANLPKDLNVALDKCPGCGIDSCDEPEPPQPRRTPIAVWIVLGVVGIMLAFGVIGYFVVRRKGEESTPLVEK